MSKTGFFMTGTDNDGFRHRYSVKKDKNFQKCFLRFMEVLGFYDDKKGISNIFLYKGEDETENEIIVKRALKDIVDETYYFKNSDYEIDVIFGKEKVIFLVRSKKRIPFVDFLIQETEFISQEEAKNVREARDKKYSLSVKKEVKSLKK